MYKRVLLKLSGELLAGGEGKGISYPALKAYASEIDKLVEQGIEVGVVVGGGNILRGREVASIHIDKGSADIVGMLSTVMNSLMLRSFLESRSQILTATSIQGVGEVFRKSRANQYLKDGKVVIFAGGTGIPYFSTDTASAIRAIDISADIILKATKVDGVYDKDPLLYQDAKRYDELSYSDLLENRLRVIDLTAAVLCMDNEVQFLIFDGSNPENIHKIVEDPSKGTLIS